MVAWRTHLATTRGLAARVPRLAWLSAGMLGLALAATLYLEASGPGYVALYDGLTPAEGGKVIAALQKLGIPYQLQAAGNVILVPSDRLATARLQLGAQQIPGTSAANAWEKVETAPITASDLAQNALTTQALQTSLAESIGSLAGVRDAEVFIAMPRETPFLADQPKPTAAVIIDAADADADALGPAIAHLVAGAVPGLDVGQISVTTTNGVRIFPASDSKTTTATQFMTVTQVESDAAARVSRLLAPILGAGHYRIAASADVDFTQVQTHEVLYGPGQMVSRQEQNESSRTGPSDLAMGIPGAMSNEPPAATTATPPAIPPTTGQPAAPQQGTNAAQPANSAAAAAGANGTSPSGTPATNAQQPHRTSSSSSQTYLTDKRESDISPPDWHVKSVAISVVLDQSVLKGIKPSDLKAAIAGAFTYPQVAVNVLVLPFSQASPLAQPFQLQQSIGPLSRAILEVLAALALLFGLALPLGRRIGTLSPPQRLLALPGAAEAIPGVAMASGELPLAGPTLAPRTEYTGLREEVAKNIPGVARLLQNWVDGHE